MGDSSDIFGDEQEQGEAAPSAAELEAAGQSAMFGSDPAPPPPVIAPVAPNQPYRVLVNGQTGEVFGTAPFSYAKLTGVIAGMFLTTLFIIIVAVLFSSMR